MKLRVALVGLALFAGCGGEPTTTGGELVLYSGRSQSLVEPLIEMFETRTGIDVRVKYGQTAQLALAIQEEGAKTPADVFWAQDAGALGVLGDGGAFVRLPDRARSRVPERLRDADGGWIATSGRARVYAYAPGRVTEEELPASVFDLTDARYRGRVGWAPLNASFQSFVTAMTVTAGTERTREWLAAMKANGAKPYPKNTAIIEAIAAGEIDFGLPNHYYLLRFKSRDPAYPVEQTSFAAGDIGNLVNVAGVGILKTAPNHGNAEKFVDFLLSPDAQEYFAAQVYEYPVIEGVEPAASLRRLDELIGVAPDVRLGDLKTLDETLALLREVGLL